jgi:signal transduction histidine kinase
VRRWRPVQLLLAGGLAVACVVEIALGGLSDGHPVFPLLVLVLALYGAGRHIPLVAAVLVAAALTGARAVLDSSVAEPADAFLTFVAALLPLLVGRWMRGQEQLRHELAAKAERLERERNRDAAQAAEEERMRIAADLEAAVTRGLEDIATGSREADRLLAAGDNAAAAGTLARIAAGAREALADVRRVLGILRRSEPPLEPVAEGVELTPTTGHPKIPATALPAALLAAAALELQLEKPGATAALSAVLIAAPLLLRVQHPLACAAGVLAAVALQSAALEPEAFPVTSIVAIISAAYALGAYTDGFAGLIAFAAGTTLHAALVHPDSLGPALIGGTLVPWTVGRIVKGRRLLMREARERARQAEREREREARAAAAAERMRVARELHDAVAHNLSVVAIQAAGAQGLVDRDPQRAAQAARLIQEVAGEALAELGRLTGEREPQPGLTDIGSLAQRARDGGLPVELQIEGDPRPLPAGVDLAAFRIVQEALANTSKHAGGASAQVVVRYAPRAVELEIEDDGRGPNGSSPRPGSGHGLIGMRERVALYGGTLEVGGRVSGGFAVRARLPVGET